MSRCSRDRSRAGSHYRNGPICGATALLIAEGQRQAAVRLRVGAHVMTKLTCTLAAVLALSNAASAADISDSRSLYAGAFGGFGFLGEASMQQLGTVITPDSFPDIDVDARGSADRVSAPIAGVQLGYELNQWDLSPSGWSVGIAGEIEGLYLAAEPQGVLDIDPQALGTQYVSLPLSVGAVLLNAVAGLRTPHSDRVIPYAGAGIGYGAVFINGSNSTNPSEPGINHFNSEPDASAAGLALQAKIGIKAAVANNWSIFTEFRHVYIASTDYTFGRTEYETHLPTTKWNVELGPQNYNLWVTGVSYRF